MKKEDLRNINKAKRKEMLPEVVFEKSKKASENFLNNEIYKSSEVLMLYYPLGKETDTSLILKNALADGKTVVYPITNTDTNEITPVVVDRRTDFSKGGYSVFEPIEKNEYKGTIDVILVPGIAFDKKGKRVGFGKGCYDRFLKRNDAIKVGYCYDFQIADDIEIDNFDVDMDYLISESGMIVCE